MNKHEAWLYLSKLYYKAYKEGRKSIKLPSQEYYILMSGICNAINKLETYGIISNETYNIMRIELEGYMIETNKIIGSYMYPVFRDPNFTSLHDLYRSIICRKLSR